MSAKERPLIVVLSENSEFVKEVVKVVREKKFRAAGMSELGEIFKAVRQKDVHGAIIDNSIEFVPGSEIADALLAISPKLRCVALRPRQVGRPPKNTPAGAFVLYSDNEIKEMVRLASSSGRGRRRVFKEPSDQLEDLLDQPLVVSRKEFQDAADMYYLKAAIEAASVKPRLVAALAEDSLASAYRLLDEYEIPYGLAAGAKPYRRKKAQKRRRRRRRRR